MENKRKTKLMLVALDGIPVEEFRKIWEEKASDCVQELWTVYPSITGPAHVSVLTGKRPEEHGIMENLVIRKERGEQLSLYHPTEEEARSVMPENTVVHRLTAEGFRCSSINWPLGKGLPGKNSTENMIRHEESSGVDAARIKDRRAMEHLKSQLEAGDWDFLAVHFEEYDSAAHMYGLRARRTKEALKRMAEYVRELMYLAERYGIKNILFFSDHGMLDKKESFFPAVYLKECGFQKEIVEGKLTFLADGSGCAQLFSSLGKEETRKAIERLKKSGKIAKIQMLEKGDGIMQGPEFLRKPSALLEMYPGICAEDIEDVAEERYQEMKGLHGYNPESVRAMNGFFMAYDPEGRLELTCGERKLTDLASMVEKLMKEGKYNESENKIGSI